MHGVPPPPSTGRLKLLCQCFFQAMRGSKQKTQQLIGEICTRRHASTSPTYPHLRVGGAQYPHLRVGGVQYPNLWVGGAKYPLPNGQGLHVKAAGNVVDGLEVLFGLTFPVVPVWGQERTLLLG